MEFGKPAARQSCFILPIRTMKQTDFLYLLIPYAVFTVWALRRYAHNGVATVCLLIGSFVFVWATFHVALYVELYSFDAERAFASVEEIMEDDASWMWRYVWEVFSPLVVVTYFSVCYVIAWLLRKRPAPRLS
jgi:hypothetical protein